MDACIGCLAIDHVLGDFAREPVDYVYGLVRVVGGMG